ncbi:hypothetical protein LJC45_04500 [Alistipes sp. OttesenSCG-928-B03]|nr:hypothetical protein [Alistipes sp. OttesenSCG-928-B03]
MRKLIFSLLFSLLMAAPLSAQFVTNVYSITTNIESLHNTRVEIEKGEKWWAISPEGFAMNMRDLSDPASDMFLTNMLVSSAGRYIWSPQLMSIDVTGDDSMTIGSDIGEVEVKKAGKTLREAYLYCMHSNVKPGVIPDGVLFSKPLYRPSLHTGVFGGQDEIVAYAERIVAEGLPRGTIVIPDGWSSIHVPFRFDAEIYPDPAALIEILHGLGFRVMLTIPSEIPALGRSYFEAAQHGRLLGTPGTPVISEGRAAFDLLDGEAEKWFAGKVTELKKQYKFDGYWYAGMPWGASALAENYMNNLAKLSSGTADVVANVYKTPMTPYVVNANRREEVAPLPEIVCNLLSASLSGISGVVIEPPFEAATTNDTTEIVHYMLLAACMPVATVDFVPWEFSEQNLQKQVKDALLFRESIAGYMEKLVEESAKTAEPIMRHMEYQFPRQGFSDCNDQFMLGSKYLIAPCMDHEAKRMVRLPKGRWKDRNGKVFKGPLVTEADCSQGLIYFEHAEGLQDILRLR